ncbi:MAG: hypothetical protein ACI81R_002299 [Bradymonadia bacterium]|jgi:hypothetical protein
MRTLSLSLLLGLAACGGETAFFAPPIDAISDTGTGDTAGEDASADVAPEDTADADDGTTSPDGEEIDATTDVAEDTTTDAGPDTTTDAGPDTTTDATTDASTDTAADTDIDGGNDVDQDVSEDIAADVQRDVSTDAVDTDAGDADTGEFVCGEDVTFIGQMFLADDEPAFSPNGGVPTSTPYAPSFDAGLNTLRAHAATEGERVFVELAVNRAMVVATSFNTDSVRFAQRNFWVADGSGVLRVFLDDEAPDATVDIVVGTELSFTATALLTYQGATQVASATDWVAHSTGGDVYVRELGAASLADAAGNIVRVTGTVSEDGVSCGGSARCYSLVRALGAPLTLRSSSNFIERGDCISFVGPVIPFAGVFQIDTLNFDWLFDYPR